MVYDRLDILEDGKEPLTIVRNYPDEAEGHTVHYLTEVSVDYVPLEENTSISVIPEVPDSPEQQGRAMLDKYLDLRDQAVDVEKTDGDRLANIQESVRQWIDHEGLLAKRPQYGAYDRSAVSKRLLGLAEYLKMHYRSDISDVELEATKAFVEAAFAMYESTPDIGQAHDVDGSFAFIVPMRASRERPDYGHEVEMVCPALRYVPKELRAALAVGVPPLVLDTYQIDEWGKRGYLVLAPIFPDMQADMPGLKALPLANRIINEAVDFANRRLGVEVVGLGAVLPSLTNYGKNIKNPNVITTTGHGGTTDLILENIVAAKERGTLSDEAMKHLGVLGLGSIGVSIADLVAERFPGSTVHVFDANPRTMKRALSTLATRKNIVSSNVENGSDVIEKSGVIISAIVGKIALKDLGVNDLSGKHFFDDSQPGSLDRTEVEGLGGILNWIIGHDTQGLVIRRGFDYGSLADRHRDAFGCELEAATLARLSQILKAQGAPDEERVKKIRSIALREKVSPQGARAFGKLFRDYGVIVAEPQVNGQLITEMNLPVAQVVGSHLPHREAMIQQKQVNGWRGMFSRLLRAASAAMF